MSFEEDLHSGSDVLAYLPEYEHSAVLSFLEEMKWILRDEIAFALTKTPEMTSKTLQFVRNHVQGSGGKSGSSVETVNLNFVFGTQQCFNKFQENLLLMEVSGFIVRGKGDFYYLNLRPSEVKTEGELRSREERVSGSKRKLHRQSRIQKLSPVKVASTPVQAELTSQTSLDYTIDSTLGSEDSSLDMVDINMWDREDRDSWCMLSSDEPGADPDKVLQVTDKNPEPECLPDEVLVSIFRFLPRKDLVNVSLVNKKFLDVSRDSSLWTKLVLDIKQIKQSVSSCLNLIERCKKLISLEITNNSHEDKSLQLFVKLVVFRAKKSLKILKVDSSIQEWSAATFKELGKMKELKRIDLTFASNCPNPCRKVQLLSNLDRLEELKVCVRTRICDSSTLATTVRFLSTALYEFENLEKVDIELEGSTTVDEDDDEPNPEFLLHFWRKRPGPWEAINGDGINLHMFMR